MVRVTNRSSCEECNSDEFEFDNEGRYICSWCGRIEPTQTEFASTSGFTNGEISSESDYTPSTVIFSKGQTDPSLIQAVVPEPVGKIKKSKLGENFENEDSKERTRRLLHEESKKTLITGKRYSWEDAKYVKQFLGLGKNQKNEHLKNEIVEIFPDINLQSEIASIIQNPSLPPRGIIIDDKKYVTPKRERIGLEVYCNYTIQQSGFWFIDDYFSRLGLNRKNVDYILSNKLPISKRVCVLFSRTLDYHELGKNFLNKCSDIYLKNGKEIEIDSEFRELISEDFWREVSLRSRRDNSINRFHFWNEINQRKGQLQPTENGLFLQHIPVAYYFAQYCWRNKVQTKSPWNSWRIVCLEILRLIENDLHWCQIEFSELNSWWDEMWLRVGDGTPSVTELL